MNRIIPILFLALALTASASLDITYQWAGTGSADFREDYSGARQGWSIIGTYDASGSGSMSTDEDSAISDVTLEGKRGTYYQVGKAGAFSSSLKIRNAKSLNVSASTASTAENVDQSFDVAGVGSASVRVIGTDEKGHPLARVSGDISGSFAGTQGVYRIGADEDPLDALAEVYAPVDLLNETEPIEDIGPAATDPEIIGDMPEDLAENVTYQNETLPEDGALADIDADDSVTNLSENATESERYAAMLEEERLRDLEAWP